MNPVILKPVDVAMRIGVGAAPFRRVEIAFARGVAQAEHLGRQHQGLLCRIPAEFSQLAGRLLAPVLGERRQRAVGVLAQAGAPVGLTEKQMEAATVGVHGRVGS